MGNDKETEVGSKQHTDLLNRIKNPFLVCAISPFHYLYFFNCKSLKFTSLLLSPAVYFLSVVSGDRFPVVQVRDLNRTKGAEAEYQNQSEDGVLPWERDGGVAYPLGTGVSFIC